VKTFRLFEYTNSLNQDVFFTDLQCVSHRLSLASFLTSRRMLFITCKVAFASVPFNRRPPRLPLLRGYQWLTISSSQRPYEGSRRSFYRQGLRGNLVFVVRHAPEGSALSRLPIEILDQIDQMVYHSVCATEPVTYGFITSELTLRVRPSSIPTSPLMLGNTHQNLTGTLLVMEGLAGEYIRKQVTTTLSDGIQTQLCS
jgi:hypothetical protein